MCWFPSVYYTMDNLTRVPPLVRADFPQQPLTPCSLSTEGAAFRASLLEHTAGSLLCRSCMLIHSCGEVVSSPKETASQLFSLLSGANNLSAPSSAVSLHLRGREWHRCPSSGCALHSPLLFSFGPSVVLCVSLCPLYKDAALVKGQRRTPLYAQ